MSVKIQIRRGTASEWATANPILDIGELGYDSTNDILKVGDGVTAWASLVDSDDQTAAQTTYLDSNQTYALGANVQLALEAIDDELIAQDGRLDVIEGSGTGSIAKALVDAKDYTDTRETAITSAYQAYADQAEVDAKSYADAQIDAAKLALGTNFSVADIAARDALEDLTVGDIIFVTDDGDTKWAQYKVTAITDGDGSTSTFEKIMDEDIYLNAISASAIKTAYESNADTNALTDALLTKINGIEAEAKDDQDADEVPYDNLTSELASTYVQGAIDEIVDRVNSIDSDFDTRITTNTNSITTINEELNIIQGDASTPGSIEAAVSYDDTPRTFALGATMQIALASIDGVLITQDADITAAEGRLDAAEGRLDAAEDRLDAAEDRLDTAEGDIGSIDNRVTNTEGRLDAAETDITNVESRLGTIEGGSSVAGSIEKALKDAKDYTDTVAAEQDDAIEINYNNATSELIATTVQDALDEIVVDLENHTTDTTIHYAQSAISITESQISDFGNYEPADATILKAADLGITVQSYDATILKSADIGVTVQSYNADTVIDANYETFDSTATYANLRAQATTAGDVGLGNVTNESKTTMFDDPTFTGAVTVPDPINTTDAANKRYVDEIAEGLKTAPAVEVATTTNLSGTYNNGTAGVGATFNLGPAATLTIDGDSIWSLYDGVLLKDQTNKFENGRYFVSQLGDGSTDWILTRCPVCDEADEIPGRYVFVKGGTVNAGSGWVQIVDDPDTFVVGTDDIEVYQFSGAGTYTAGSGLTLTGNEFALSGDSFDADGTFASLRAQATTKEDVGLTNVTDDAQVKKAASSTDGYVPKWSGTDGDAIIDGYGVQTTLTSSTIELVRADAIVAALSLKADKLADIDTKTATFTVAAAEANKVVVLNNGATDITITLPTDAAEALPIGTQMSFIRNGTGTVTFASAATILSDGSKKKIKAQYTSAAVVKIAADTWQLVGNLAA